MKSCFLKYFWFSLAMLAGMKSYGCTCNMPRTVKESVERAPTILVGNVLAESTADLGEGEMRAYLVKVRKIFKGNVRSDTVVVLTNFHEASCGIRFRVHSKIIVFASASLPGDKPINTNRFFKTSLCTYSGLYKESYGKQVVAAIGKP